MKRINSVLIFGVLALLSACGGSGLYCNYPSSGLCIDYTGSGFTAATVQAGCTTGTYGASGGCSTANRVGSCKDSSNPATEATIRYYSPTFDASTAQSSCASPKVFTPN